MLTSPTVAQMLLIGLAACLVRTSEAESFKECDECPTMIVVPAGSFVMGEPELPDGERKRGWGGPEVTITIAKPFAMAQMEITRAQFAAFVRETGYGSEGVCRSMWPAESQDAPPPTWRDPRLPSGERQLDDHPVVCIAHSDALAYIAWLNTKSDGSRTYHLPSEAQFEYAARAGTTGPWPWPGGSMREICRHANVADKSHAALNPQAQGFDCDDGHAFIAPVGSFRANAFGLHDLIGNVWEWARDCAADDEDLTTYPRDGSALESAPADCSKRVTRGGGFVSPEWWTRVTARGGGHDPETRINAMGFRVAAELR